MVNYKAVIKKALFFLSTLLGTLTAISLQAQVNLKSISVGASYWKPSLDYWNERSILTMYNNGAGATLSGRIVPTAAIEIGLTQHLSISGRIGYWSNSAAGNLRINGIDRTEKLTLSIIPASLDLKYAFVGENSPKEATDKGTKEDGPSLVPYVGVSVSRYFISNEFSRQVINDSGSVQQTQAGNSYGIQAFAGLEKKIVKRLYGALEARYHLGSYNQAVSNGVSDITEKISLNGLETGLSLRIKFN